MAWAVGRVGHLRVDPAGPAAPVFEADELEELLDDARAWERVRDPGMLDPDLLLGRVVGGLFGARMDGPGGRFELRPFVPEGWRGLALRRLRAHRTVLDVEVRPRAEWVTVRVALTFGPPLATAVSVAGVGPVERAVVDEIPLGAPQAVFTAQAEHEITFFLR